MKHAIFTGACTALVTPMDSAGQVNLAELSRLVEDQIRQGIDALLVCGTTGESATLSDAEQAACIRCAVGTAQGRVPIVAGTGSNDTQHAIALSQQAETLGADALLLVTPYYNKTNQNGLIQHFTAIADAVKLPILLYNVPSRTGCNLLPDTVCTLAQHPRIVGIKEASGNMHQCMQIAASCPEDFALYSGNDDQVLPLLSLGGKGVISVVSNIAPRQVHAMCAAWIQQDFAAARRAQFALLPLCQALFCDVNPMPVKYAMQVQGWQVGGCRLPLTQLSDAQKASLTACMHNIPAHFV